MNRRVYLLDRDVVVDVNSAAVEYRHLDGFISEKTAQRQKIKNWTTMGRAEEGIIIINNS